MNQPQRAKDVTGSHIPESESRLPVPVPVPVTLSQSHSQSSASAHRPEAAAATVECIGDSTTADKDTNGHDVKKPSRQSLLEHLASHLRTRAERMKNDRPTSVRATEFEGLDEGYDYLIIQSKILLFLVVDFFFDKLEIDLITTSLQGRRPPTRNWIWTNV